MYEIKYVFQTLIHLQTTWVDCVVIMMGFIIVFKQFTHLINSHIVGIIKWIGCMGCITITWCWQFTWRPGFDDITSLDDELVYIRMFRVITHEILWMVQKSGTWPSLCPIWRSLNLWRVTFSPSQIGHQQNCQEHVMFFFGWLRLVNLGPRLFTLAPLLLGLYSFTKWEIYSLENPGKMGRNRRKQKANGLENSRTGEISWNFK